ncbi:putative Sin3 binding protein-domain-containing protein [Lineolata rhizophorae]|uniref:Putative Sin3 binding protein-domain-containing protein n=1 Tax=Lineolata rhizophorae TaxID=578093 RepID=A0A6A6NX11_9PEZI|nr:putative Sin3 binding protein-domain-containing protein [Lineolata rhizophorae]
MASAADAHPVSNIAVALSGKSASVDIPRPRAELDHHDQLADGHHHNHHHSLQHTNHSYPRGCAPLPTPPHSISPPLPPHKARPGHPDPTATTRTPPPNVDSDIDLQDAVEHANAQSDAPHPLSSAALSGLDHAITSGFLAKHHLPEILLSNGPVAIRHVLSYLTQSVPGFSRIPPAKARRIVVGALENRAGGGVNGDVVFEKVGWGRWDAHMKGQPSRNFPNAVVTSSTAAAGGMDPAQMGFSPPASVPDSYAVSNASGLRIPQGGRAWGSDVRRDGGQFGRSWTADSMMSSREDMDDMNMAEHEADKMSLDGRDHASCSYSSSAPEELPGLADDMDDLTDEEDWASMGADALRQHFPPATGDFKMRNYNRLSRATARVKSSRAASTGLAKSVPAPGLTYCHDQHHGRGGRSVSAQYPRNSSSTSHVQHSSATTGGTGLQSLGYDGVMGEEREAAETLLSMGSM